MLYSVIIPVYNRPDEIDELLESLTSQTRKNFEVLVIDDGSENRCDHIAEKYMNVLDVNYFYKENSGQGFARNYGFQKANGDYFVVFDSDCIIPDTYFESVSRFLFLNQTDCWGGPDRAHPSFTPLQKAINYSMTSFLTTGGIRGGKKRVDSFHPRSFNMGISREVFEKTGGYKLTRMGEDIEFSLRIIEMGFKTALIPDAYVYHKRRTDFKQFYSQLHFFGRARINIKRFYPDELKPLHFFPAVFILLLAGSLLLSFVSPVPFIYLLLIYLVYTLALFLDSLRTEKSVTIAALAVAASYIQFTAYGVGFLSELARK